MRHLRRYLPKLRDSGSAPLPSSCHNWLWQYNARFETVVLPLQFDENYVLSGTNMRSIRHDPQRRNTILSISPSGCRSRHPGGTRALMASSAPRSGVHSCHPMWGVRFSVVAETSSYPFHVRYK